MEEIKDYKKEFEKGFQKLLYSKSPYEVWSDLMYMYAISIQNSFTKDIDFFNEVWNEREKIYLRTINKYKKPEQELICQMFAYIVLELERNPDQDLLGSIYMNLGIGNKNAGQFFTPYSVCDMMARINLTKPTMRKIIKKDGYASVYDCACGAGATLVAAVSQCKRIFNRLNYQNHVFFVGQDVDITVLNMCYIQLSLLGVAGFLKHGNTLVDPEFCLKNKGDLINYYFTPVYFSNIWTQRRFFHGLGLFMNGGAKNGRIQIQKKEKC